MIRWFHRWRGGGLTPSPPDAVALVLVGAPPSGEPSSAPGSWRLVRLVDRENTDGEDTVESDLGAGWLSNVPVDNGDTSSTTASITEGRGGIDVESSTTEGKGGIDVESSTTEGRGGIDVESRVPIASSVSVG